MKRHNAGKACVIPVKLRLIDNWQATPFGHLQCLPDNGEPITSKSWPRQDDAFVNIVGNIRQEVEKIQEEQRQLELIRDQQKSEIFASINRFVSNHSINRIIPGINIPTFLVGAASIIGVVVLLGFCNSSPEIQVNSLLTQGQDKLDRRDYQGASEDYTQAIQIAPKNSDAYIKRGDARYSLKDYQGAIKDYTQAIQIAPQNVNSYIQRGHVRHILKDYEGAIKDYTQAIEIMPKNVNAYVKRGDTQYCIKKYQAAIDDYTTAIRLSPDSADPYKSRGFIYKNNLQNKEQAIRDFQRINYSKKNKRQVFSRMIIILRREKRGC